MLVVGLNENGLIFLFDMDEYQLVDYGIVTHISYPSFDEFEQNERIIQKYFLDLKIPLSADVEPFVLNNGTRYVEANINTWIDIYIKLLDIINHDLEINNYTTYDWKEFLRYLIGKYFQDINILDLSDYLRDILQIDQATLISSRNKYTLSDWLSNIKQPSPLVKSAFKE